MKLGNSIGFVVLSALLVVCSTAFANEHQVALSKLMKVQNCSFDLSSYNVTNINVQRLHAQHLETLRNVNQITQSTVARLLRDNYRLVTLAPKLSTGLRFGSDCTSATPSEDLQLGTGELNYRESIQSTGEELKRFGHALNDLAEEWRKAGVDAKQSPYASKLANRDRTKNIPLAINLTQFAKSTLNRLIQVELAQSPSIQSIASELLEGYKFDKTGHGYGEINWRESAIESATQMKRFADGLIGIANQWRDQLWLQMRKCELYLQDTFTQNTPCFNTTVVGI